MLAQHHRNEVHLAGILDEAPTVRLTAKRLKVANFKIKIIRKNTAEWHRCVAWEHAAEKVELLTAGDFIQILGRLQTRSYEEKETKQRRYIAEVVVWQIVVPGKEDVTISTTGVEITDADIPF